MNSQAFTLFHVALSLIGILTGFVMLFGFIGAKWNDVFIKIFLWTTLLTSVTGFMFPYKGVTPGIILGIISVVVLAISFYALYAGKTIGAWAKIFVVTTAIAQYLNFFVLIAQSFRKVPALKALAPTQSEAPFKAAQGVALLLFVILTILAAKNVRGKALQSA
jgi:hypothetical protein